MNLEDIQKLALEWQEEKQKEVQRKIQADAVSQDASVKINMIDGGLQFAEILAKNLQQQPGVVDIGTKGTSKRTKR
tara:strand:+ start:603 stop:830 length:228 start_codon:yes stop_codon:yes gene_type:complete